jgi:hypothetical protein
MKYYYRFCEGDFKKINGAKKRKTIVEENYYWQK